MIKFSVDFFFFFDFYRKLKQKCFQSLQAMEADLISLGGLIPSRDSAEALALHIQTAPLGFVTPRTGGHPMILSFFTTPYHLLENEKGSAKDISTPVSLQTLRDNDVGYSVSVCIESCRQTYNLQTSPILMMHDPAKG